MKKANIIAGFLGILLGGYVVYTAAGYPENLSAVDPGSAYFPTLIGYFLIVLCLILIALSLMGRGADINEVIQITPGIRRAGLGVVLFTVYCALFRPLGFILDTILFCFTCMLLLQNRKYIQMLIVSMTTSVAIYFVFASLLGAKLPAGLLKVFL